LQSFAGPKNVKKHSLLPLNFFQDFIKVEFIVAVMIKTPTQRAILYYAEMESNVKLNFKMNYNKIEITPLWIFLNFSFGKLLYFCSQSFKI